MGVGTGSFPPSAEPNGVKSSADRGEHGQKRQQQEQQDNIPEDMPPLQPLARPINNRIDPAHIPRPEWNGMPNDGDACLVGAAAVYAQAMPPWLYCAW